MKTLVNPARKSQQIEQMKQEIVLKVAIQEGGELANIPLHLIISDPDQPRFIFRNIESLAKTINEVGLIQAIVVRRLDDGRYMLVVGERRLKAVILLGWKTIPSVILPHLNDNVLSLIADIQMAENKEREFLTPYEEAIWYVNFTKRFYKGDREKLRKVLKCTKSYLSDRFSLAAAPEPVKEFALSGVTQDIVACVMLNRLYKHNPESAIKWIAEANAKRLEKPIRASLKEAIKKKGVVVKRNSAIKIKSISFKNDNEISIISIKIDNNLRQYHVPRSVLTAAINKYISVEK